MRDILFFPPVFDSVLFRDPQGAGLPNQSTNLQNSNFPTYKRNLHHKAATWMRTKHAPVGWFLTREIMKGIMGGILVKV